MKQAKKKSKGTHIYVPLAVHALAKRLSLVRGGVPISLCIRHALEVAIKNEEAKG